MQPVSFNATAKLLFEENKPGDHGWQFLIKCSY